MAEISADPDVVFSNRIKELTKSAAADAQATLNQASGDWDQPQDWSGDPLDIPGLIPAYDRANIGTSYAGLYADRSKPGPSGVAAALTLQGDHLAADERALRARYATPVRLALLAAGRRKGHGNEGGVFQQVILRQVQDMLRISHSNPAKP